MRRSLALSIPVLAVLIGGAACPPASADPAQSPQTVDRFTHDIWPAIAAYHNGQTQTSAGSVALNRVIDPELQGDNWGALKSAAGALGHNGYDSATQTSHYSMGLQLGGVNVTAADSESATLDVCYTYTHYWYVDVRNTHQAPGTSQAVFTLTNNGGTWMLHSITGDHVVPDCTGA